MIRDKNLILSNTPLMFSDGSRVYNELKREYKNHKKGFFILAPSGAGKTYYIKNQKSKNWIDGDILWEATNAHPREEWWLNLDSITEVDQKSDIITSQAKKMGFWIMGASNYWLKPDAVVVPNWSKHKKYIKIREENHYDGGAKSDKLQLVLSHRKEILKWAKKGVPKFDSIEKAVDYLSLS
ncbi:MAG: hypothetical protein ACD_7C00526G0002 [uncultured bacterium]|nr:MAG: hypothetical protein ACD_7C00526G0002 [uncultured bacterium]HBR79099.1 hypothetical protein [Candidatus Moranbacteria bacterium]